MDAQTDSQMIWTAVIIGSILISSLFVFIIEIRRRIVRAGMNRQNTPIPEDQLPERLLRELQKRDVAAFNRIRMGTRCTDKTDLLGVQNLDHAVLRGIRLDNVSLPASSFFQADLSCAVLMGAHMPRSALTEVILERAMLEGCNLTEADLTRANMQHVNGPRLILEKSTCNQAVFDEATLESARFSRAQANDASFRGANLSRASLYGIACHRASFKGARMHHTDLEASDATRADFRKIESESLKAFGATLKGADFTGANLFKANFDNANLTGANFQDANLSEATFRCALLAGASFHGTTGLDPEVFERCVEETRPEGCRHIPKLAPEPTSDAPEAPVPTS